MHYLATGTTRLTKFDALVAADVAAAVIGSVVL